MTHTSAGLHLECSVFDATARLGVVCTLAQQQPQRPEPQGDSREMLELLDYLRRATKRGD